MILELIEDMAKYLPSIIAPALVGFIAIPIITRLFSTGDYGIYVLVMATISILVTLNGWLSMSIIRFYPAYEKDGGLKEFDSTLLKLLVISIAALTSIFLGIFVLAKAHISSTLYNLMLIGVLVFILTTSFEVLQNFLRAKRQVNLYTGFSVWKSVTALAFGIALVVVFGYGVEGLLWGSILSVIIALPLLWKIAVEKSPLKSKGISIPLTSEMAKYGFPLVVGNLAAWILSLSDRYILELFRGSHEVGIYSASYGISQTSILLIVSLFLISGAPIAINVWEKQGERASQEFVSKLTRYYLIFCLPAIIGLSILAKPAISVLTAQEYWEGCRIIPFVALSVFFLGLTQWFGIGLVYYKKTHFAMFCTLASGLLNLGLNFLLIPKYGYIAAAGTTLISYAFFLLLQGVISRRFFVWEFPFKSLAKVSCASTIMAMVVYPVGNSLTSSTLINLIGGICVGAVVYFLMLFLLREFQKEEIQELQELKSGILMKIRQLITNRK